MLEPLFRCNLACAGCGKIQYPAQILRKHLTVEQCLAAVDECGTPVVSIPAASRSCIRTSGASSSRWSPVANTSTSAPTPSSSRKKLEAGLFTPSKYFSFSVHLDGLRDQHDEAVCRDGLRPGRGGDEGSAPPRLPVTTNTTLFDGASPLRMREFFDTMMDLGVEGMMISPGYSYSKAPDQEHFLRTQRAHDLFSTMLSNPKKRWRFNQSPLFLQFLMGKREFECTPWGNPTYNVFGWQRPCTSSRRATRRPSRSCSRPRAGELRAAERQRKVPRLHGALRVRADGGEPHVRLVARIPRHRRRHGRRALLTPVPP